jgi:peptidyl-prolyl cis-trans isomerase C
MTTTLHSTPNMTIHPVARIGDVALHAEGEQLDTAELRQRACTELLRQRAMATGRLGRDDAAPVEGVISAAAAAAISELLDTELEVPEPDDAACRRHHAAHLSRYAVGERVLARHILYAVTPGVDITALRSRAEHTLLEVRAEPALFAQRAQAQSNCPSGQDGGALGWLGATDCAPEFARELFGHAEVGVLPRLVHSRHGLHVIEVQAREAGEQPPYEAVAAAVAATLRRQSYATALRQYLQQLAAAADIDGIDLAGSAAPLVQ